MFRPTMVRRDSRPAGGKRWSGALAMGDADRWSEGDQGGRASGRPSRADLPQRVGRHQPTRTGETESDTGA